MPIPQLSEDILTKILSYSFDIYSVSSPFSPPTPLKGTSSLLLISKLVHELSLPFFWRSITVHQPSDFITLFDPEDGLLASKGELGDRRRSWVKELCFGEGAAAPYDETKVSKLSKLLSSRYNLLIQPSRIILPNLRHVCLGDSGYLIPFGLSSLNGKRTTTTTTTHPSYQRLLQKLWIHHHHSFKEDWFDEFKAPEACKLLIKAFPDVFEHLAASSHRLIGSLLAPHGPQLETFRLLFSLPRPVGSKRSLLYPRTGDYRIPKSLLQAGVNQHLVVTLYTTTPPVLHPLKLDAPVAPLPDLDLAGSLSKQFPRDAEVRIVRREGMELLKKQMEKGARKASDEQKERWGNWRWVEEEGRLSLFVPAA
ncbi:hypothetical protein BDY24DRAFT_396523 [Mrakia frigida]|uniref:uncharacterized protein n=1 Tax=Mrakia frigida TaxID=29902 RepID=UPI003FCBF22E